MIILIIFELKEKQILFFLYGYLLQSGALLLGLAKSDYILWLGILCTISVLFHQSFTK